MRIQRNGEILDLPRDEYAQLECNIFAIEIDHIFLLQENKDLGKIPKDQFDGWRQFIVFVVFGVDLFLESNRLDLDVEQLCLLSDRLHAVEGVLLGYLSHSVESFYDSVCL